MQIIYGGSFNPPTLAHVKIAQYLLNKYPQAEFIFLPTNNFYVKDNLKDFQIRWKMLEIVCRYLENRPIISDFELKLDRFYGTDYTLNHFPGSLFVIGADNLLTLPHWINYPEVIINHQYLVIPRNNLDIEKIFQNNPLINQYRHNFLVLEDFQEIYISSSDYRKSKDNRLLIPEISQFISDNHLYKE